MHRLLPIILILFVFGSYLSCKKELVPEDIVNPSVKFIKPYSDTSVFYLDTVFFEIEAKDYQHTIGVKVFIDGTQVYNLLEPPFKFSLIADWFGERVFQALVIDMHRNVGVGGDTIRVSADYDPNNFFTDQRDGKTYPLVKFGEQTWMAKNLAYLPDLEEMLPASFTEPFYYVYDYREKPMLTKQAKETQNYKTYGVIYNLPASKTSVCPDGWHVSSGTEWEQLIDFVGENSAQKLRAKVGWDQENEELDITRSGFDALPGGILGYAESSGGASYYRQGGIGKQAWFWNSEGNKLWKIDKFSPEVVESGILSNPIGASVRCVKDE